jgi:hypothetical protein
MKGSLIFCLLTMLAANFFFQRKLRTLFVFRMKVENLYKEQAEIFENITDGAIIYSKNNKDEIK